MEKHRQTALRIIERCLLTLGLVLLGFYVMARIHGVITLHAALRSFEESKEAAAADPAGSKPSSTTKKLTRTNYSLWSPERIRAYKSSFSRMSSPPLAVLKIRKFRLEVPVFDGMDDVTLNAGVGRIPGTARPDQRGNIGIAGHRDGFFRCLKDIAKGDTIELVTKNETKHFVVDKITITKPDDVQVLRPARPGLTLVTCYPFYYIGSAPKRYIVQASLKQEG